MRKKLLTAYLKCDNINLSQICDRREVQQLVNVPMLRGKVIEKGLTLEKVADKIGIDKSTMSRKLGNLGEDFTIKQADDLVNLLGLTSSEATAIFFSQFVAQMQQ